MVKVIFFKSYLSRYAYSYKAAHSGWERGGDVVSTRKTKERVCAIIINQVRGVRGSLLFRGENKLSNLKPCQYMGDPCKDVQREFVPADKKCEFKRISICLCDQDILIIDLKS